MSYWYYYNPLAQATVRGERVDQGVDYAFSDGYLTFIGDAYVTAINNSSWMPYGRYVEYRITQAGPLHGMYVYYAEGVKPVVVQGNSYPGGSRCCEVDLSFGHGIEIGWAAGSGNHSWAHTYGGGYREGWSTQSGISFNRLIRLLGGPGGNIQRRVMGRAPALSYRYIRPAHARPQSGPHPPAPSPTDTAVYDPSPIIRNSTYWLGVHGYRAYANADIALRYVQQTHYITTMGRV